MPAPGQLVRITKKVIFLYAVNKLTDVYFIQLLVRVISTVPCKGALRFFYL